MPETASTAIEVDRISKRFAKTGTVIDGISFAVKTGAFVSLLGPSGSGKTTLLRILSGIEAADSGSLRFDHPSHPGDLAFVFQEAALCPWLSVEENVRLPCRLLKRAVGQTELTAVMDLVGLGRARHLLPRELSGGMKMRASLARALITQPKFLFLDEPFASLDEIIRLEIEEELSAITHRLSMTTCLVTHSITESVFLSDEIYLLSSKTHAMKNSYVVSQTRPRQNDFRMAPEFARLVGRIREDFRSLGSQA